jgi:4-carboxymuconolactone decarboxylase
MSESERAARIAPLEGDFEGLPSLNVMRTLMKNEPVAKRFGRLAGYLLVKGQLPARERELVILRVGWRSGSVYEFGQHTLMGRTAGVTDPEIARLTEASTDGWDEADRDLVVFADELCATNTVSDDTWARLAARWSESELIELLVVAGLYRLVSGFLNAVGVELDAGVPGWPGEG